MNEPYVGQISVFAFDYAPQHHAFCAGQLLPISQNTALFSLLGTTFGGNGITSFALPNLQGRIVIGRGQGPGLADYVLGEIEGSENVTLITSEMAQHAHTFDASAVSGTLQARNAAGDSRDAAGHVPAIESTGVTAGYSSGALDASLKSDAVAIGGTLALAASGGSQPHPNMQPFLALNYCLALTGVFPARP